MKVLRVSILLLSIFILYSTAFSVEVAPRISDREIIERLSRLEEGQKSLWTELDARFGAIDKRFDDLRSEMNNRFDAMDRRFDAMDKRFDDLAWMMKLFIGIATVILGFVLRMQWQMNRRQAQMETSLETQKDEIKFLKEFIEKTLVVNITKKG